MNVINLDITVELDNVWMTSLPDIPPNIPFHSTPLMSSQV